MLPWAQILSGRVAEGGDKEREKAPVLIKAYFDPEGTKLG